jgi:hypothetical protein
LRGERHDPGRKKQKHVDQFAAHETHGVKKWEIGNFKDRMKLELSVVASPCSPGLPIQIII